MENSVNQPQSDDIVTQVPMKDRRPLPADVVNFPQFKCSYFSDRIPVFFRKEKNIEGLQNLTLGNYAGSTSKFVNCIPFREEYLGIYTTSFSNDGSVVAIGLGNGDVQIFNKKTNELVKVLSSPLVGYPTTCVKFHPLSTDLLCCGSASGVITLCNTEGEIKLTIEEENNEVNILDIDWTGNTLITGGKDAIIRIYDIYSEQEVKSYGSLDPLTSGLMESHNMRIYSLKFRREEEFVFASGGWDGTVKVWDTRTVVGLVKTIQGPFIYGDAIDIKDRTILTGSYRGINNLQLWDFGSGLLVNNISPLNRLVSLDGDQLYTAKFFSGEPNGDLIICGGSGYGSLRVISIKENLIVRAFPENKPIITSACFEEDICYGGMSGNCCLVKYLLGGDEEEVQSAGKEVKDTDVKSIPSSKKEAGELEEQKTDEENDKEE